MKTAVYYRTFNHGTEMYAKWLAEDLHADIYQYGWLNNADFKDYDRIIVMSSVYMFKFMPLKGFLIKNWNKIKDKEVIAISCGAAPEADPVTIKVHERVPQEIRDRIKFYTLKGSQPGAKGEAQAKDIRKENVDALIKKLGGQ